VGDLAYLIWRDLRQRRALRAPRAEYGSLDYEPEFIKANDRYLEAQQQITIATTSTGEIFARNSGMTSQAQADECGNASKHLCEVHARVLPVMSENGAITRECLRGFLKMSRPTNESERDALRGLLASTRDARMSTKVGSLRVVPTGVAHLASILWAR
jgi:hypothetical protein